MPPPNGRGPTWPTAGQNEEEQRRIAREVLAEAMPATAGEMYTANCPIGITVAFTRPVQAGDLTTLKDAFRSITRIYRSEGTIYAAFATTADRDAVLERLKGACDHQGDLQSPLTILPVDLGAQPAVAASPVAARPIAFGSQAVMEVDLQVATQPQAGLQLSPASGAKRARPDQEDPHDMARFAEEDSLERRFGEVNSRISLEVNNLKKDITNVGDKVAELATFIKAMPSTPATPWMLMPRGSKWSVPTGTCEKGSVFWVIARDGRFSPWAAYEVKVTGVAPNGAKLAFQGALLEERAVGDSGPGAPLGTIVEGETTDLWEEVEARNAVVGE